MNIIRPDAKELYNADPQKHIEAIGRICYKSEDKITDISNKKFISDLYKRKHWAMLEHFRFIVGVNSRIYELVGGVGSAYIVCTSVHTNANDNYRYIISGSARGFIEAIENVEYEIKYNRYTRLSYANLAALTAVVQHIIYEYRCFELFGGYTACRQPSMMCIKDFDVLSGYEFNMHGWHSVRFICDRGISHELVRHRPASFAQESTRYCNYSNDKFGNEISVIEPLFFEHNTEEYILWEKCMRYDEVMYFELLHCGKIPQEARTVLPNSLKTDIVLTATNHEWEHILDLRYKGATGAPHPQMVEVMKILVENNDWAHELIADSDV